MSPGFKSPSNQSLSKIKSGCATCPGSLRTSNLHPKIMMSFKAIKTVKPSSGIQFKKKKKIAKIMKVVRNTAGALTMMTAAGILCEGRNVAEKTSSMKTKIWKRSKVQGGILFQPGESLKVTAG